MNIETIKENEHKVLETPIAMFSKNNIVFVASIFSPLIGGLMFFYNLRKHALNNRRNIILLLCYLVLSFILILAFNVLYTVYLGDLIRNFIDSEYLNLRYSSLTFKIAFKLLINGIAIDYLWNIFFGKDLKYRSKDITIPVIIGIVLLAFTFYYFT